MTAADTCFQLMQVVPVWPLERLGSNLAILQCSERYCEVMDASHMQLPDLIVNYSNHAVGKVLSTNSASCTTRYSWKHFHITREHIKDLLWFYECWTERKERNIKEKKKYNSMQHAEYPRISPLLLYPIETDTLYENATLIPTLFQKVLPITTASPIISWHNLFYFLRFLKAFL